MFHSVDRLEVFLLDHLEGSKASSCLVFLPFQDNVDDFSELSEVVLHSLFRDDSWQASYEASVAFFLKVGMVFVN